MIKGLECLNECKKEWCKNCNSPCNGCAIEQIEKELKALEIIKPYIDELIGCNAYDKDFKEYFIQTKYGRKLISKEAYDLLKEVSL